MAFVDSPYLCGHVTSRIGIQNVGMHKQIKSKVKTLKHIPCISETTKPIHIMTIQDSVAAMKVKLNFTDQGYTSNVFDNCRICFVE